MSDLIKAIKYQYPEVLPVWVGILPAAWKKYGDEMRTMTAKYPQFFGDISEKYSYDMYTPKTYHVGKYPDEWNCIWENIVEGMEAYVTGHPIKTHDDIRNLQIPANTDGRIPHGFMYLRLTDLCGFEFCMELFAEEEPELQMLIDKVVAYNEIQIKAIVDKQGEMMYFGDDLGMQKGLAVGAARWRKYLKPAFTKLYKIVKDTGRMVYMHTDGCIWEIMPDLVDCGVDMINPQFRANGIDKLVEVCKGKIPINLDLDRQLFPVCTPQDIRDHVRECIEKMYLPQGGLAINVELSQDIPIENMYAVLDEVDKYRFYKGVKL